MAASDSALQQDAVLDLEYDEDDVFSEISDLSSGKPSSSEELESGVEEEDEGQMIDQSEQAEDEIDGDFELLVQNIRLRDSSSTTGVLTKDWDINIEEREQEFRDDLREASGIGRKRTKKGRVAGPVLSHQVRSLIGDGNQAYVDNNLPEAIRVMQEVIRIEPRATAAWTVLAQCYEDMGESPKALKLRIMAAHLRRDPDEWDRLACQSRENGYNQQALYCYRKVCSLDPANVVAFWNRASLAKEIGDFRSARNAFLAILKKFPHDLAVLRELHTVLLELSELPTCATLLQEAFDHYQVAYSSGHGLDPVSGALVTGSGFTNLDLLLLADLHNALGEHLQAIHVIRKGTRWLQGRADQKYWDRCDDDREYDIEGWPPRLHPEETERVLPGRHALDPNARHRLAVSRIKMGEIGEGKLHANAILSEDVLDYAVLFGEIADAYFERELYADAKSIYEKLGSDVATSSIYVLLRTAACYRMLDELKEAAEVYEHIRLVDPTLNDAKMKLAEIYEMMNEPRKALELVYEVIDSRKKKPRDPTNPSSEDIVNPPGPSLFSEEKASSKTKTVPRTQSRLTQVQLRELEKEKEKEVMQGYRRVGELWAAMLRGEAEPERQWIIESEKLIETFRETRNLFSTSRTHPFRGMFPRSRKAKEPSQIEADEERMASRLQLDLERDSLSRKAGKSPEKSGAVDIFRGISFDDWLRLFMQYCFILTKSGQYEVADEILRHILVSNAYQQRARQDTIRLTLITCAISAQRHNVVVEQARKLITAHQFNNEPFRILLACLAGGLRPTDAFITSTLQKHMFREMKLADVAVKNPSALRWNNANKRYAMMAQGKAGADQDVVGEDEPDDENEMESEVGQEKASLREIPTEHNPVIVAIYGQICIAAKSYQSAIFYLLHAYDYCEDDPMICLCLAIASIGRAMQRQADNRHHLIAQAMAFLTKYRNLRGTDAQAMCEVEFNFGRTFHQLGLYTHAVVHYERVLDLAEQGKDETFAKEAAHNLSLIFVLTGATPFADALYRRWLSL